MKPISSTITLHRRDNVCVALEQIGDIPRGHKIALAPIAQGEQVIKYGYPIGIATQDIAKGEWVHTHNIRTGLGKMLDYTYAPSLHGDTPQRPDTFMGYLREDGKVGVRNEVWIIPTVGCVNQSAALLAQKANERTGGNPKVIAYGHPYGCSQAGEDRRNTQNILSGLVRNPNAGGVLVLGLGCEENYVAAFKEVLGEYNPDRVKFMVTQEVEDELASGMELLDELIAYTNTHKRTEIPTSKLIIGLKCGGSDGFSGITANPLLGRISDRIIDQGGTSMLTEVPEMFGAETILMERCIDEETFQRAVKIVNDTKQTYIDLGQNVYENPSPGNKEGGITTLEDKSLGCTQKGGTRDVVEVVYYGHTMEKGGGLVLVGGPGNDICAVTALSAAGAAIILFTTGRGTPLGAPVPVLKVSTNTPLSQKKPGWIDYNAGVLVEGTDMDAATDQLWDLVLETASGKETCSERNGYRDMAIVRGGVTH